MAWRPQVGLRCSDSYLHGNTENRCVGEEGVIEHVGIDYFILRVDDRPYMVTEDGYWCIGAKDFN